MSFLHGIETIQVNQGSAAINIVKSGVIGLIGIAPQGPKNQILLISSTNEASTFGNQVPGFNIPQSLSVMLAQGAGAIVVVNVFDETKHTLAVTSESQTVTNGVLKLAFAPIGSVTIKDSENADVTFVKDTDYSLDEFGNFKVMSSAIANGLSLKFTYKKLDLSGLTGSDLVGAYNSETGARTGMKCFDNCFNVLGYNPKIFVSPQFSTLSGVLSGLIEAAEKFKGIVYHDAPLGTTVSAAIAGRGPTGTFGFNTSSKRVELCYPHIKKYDPATNTHVNFPMSAYLSGLRAALDNSQGFWVSTSNKELKSAAGLERNLSASLNDLNSDANKLNSAGITTVFNSFGTGLRAWGNRNASYPTLTTADNFTNTVRIDDVVSESIEQAALQFIDQPINQALIDTIRESGNSFIRLLISRGALLPGSKILFNKEDNSAEQLSNGHIVFERIYMVPTPAERITFKSILDISLLNNFS